MKCVEREQLFAYVHGMLGAQEEGEIRAHVEQCAECRSAAEEFRKLDAVLDEWEPTEPSPWFDARVRAAVAASEPPPSPVLLGFEWGRWLAPALLVVLVVAGSLVVYRSRQPQVVPQPVARQEAPKPVAPATVEPATVAQGEADELSLYQNLPVLEEYEILANFDVLSELPKGEKKVAN